MLQRLGSSPAHLRGAAVAAAAGRANLRCERNLTLTLLPAARPAPLPARSFDPLNFKGGDSYAKLQVNEIKNGRLAMLAFSGARARPRARVLAPARARADGLLAHAARVLPLAAFALAQVWSPSPP
jgi:hypothetical protein